MRITLLFIFLLNSAHGDNDVRGCLGGWIEFTCIYRNKPNLLVEAPQERKIKGQNIAENRWRPLDDQRSVFHNSSEKYWRVFVKRLIQKDFGEYECKNDHKGEIKLKGNNDCPKDLKISQTGANITISCNYPDVNFICKESSQSCEILAWGQRPVYAISNVTLQDRGDYWCGKESQRRDYKVSRHKTHLQVVEVTKRSLRPGENLTQSCSYTNVGFKKFVCKGENTTVCPELVSTSSTTNGRFSLQDERKSWSIILTIRNVTMENSGSYWCATERTSIGKDIQFSHKLELVVVQMPLTTPPAQPDIPNSTSSYIKRTSVSTASPTQTQSPYHQDDHQKILIIAAVVCAGVLFLALSAFCIHKIRRGFTDTKTANKEEHCYEEIQERPLQIASGTALNTIYATASAPVAPSSKSGNLHKTSDDRFKENVLYSTSAAH